MRKVEETKKEETKVEEENELIDIVEDVRIGENTILEKGDRIEVLKEFDYFTQQLSYLEDSPYGYKIQIQDGVGNSTKWMNLNSELYEKLEVLIKI